MSSNDGEKQRNNIKWRLSHIVDNCTLATQFVGDRDAEAFCKDIQVVKATEQCVQIVSEAMIGLGEYVFHRIVPEENWHDIRVVLQKLPLPV